MDMSQNGKGQRMVSDSWERFCGFHSGWELLTRKYHTWPLAWICNKIQNLLLWAEKGIIHNCYLIWSSSHLLLTELFCLEELHHLKVPYVSNYMLHNQANITKKKKAHEASKICSSRWHFYQLTESFTEVKERSTLAWVMPGNVCHSQNISFIQLTFINPLSILITPGKHPNSSVSGFCSCRQPHLILLLGPTNPNIQPFTAWMFAISACDQWPQAADDM